MGSGGDVATMTATVRAVTAGAVAAANNDPATTAFSLLQAYGSALMYGGF